MEQTFLTLAQKPLSKEDILSYLPCCGINIQTFPVIDSTNTYARKLLSEGLKPPLLLCADEQTAGRGRRGNSFYSPLSGLYYTLVIQPKDIYEAISRMTIAAAVSTRYAIEKTTCISCDIKWVNDLYLNNRKIGGILCEAPRNGHNELQGIIIGIGINIDQKVFPEELKFKAGSLNCPDLDRNKLAAELTKQLLYWAEHLGSEELLQEYKKHSFLLGKEVSFVLNGTEHTGIASDINNEGNLIVHGDSTWILSSGEVSLKSWD